MSQGHMSQSKRVPSDQAKRIQLDKLLTYDVMMLDYNPKHKRNIFYLKKKHIKTHTKINK